MQEVMNIVKHSSLTLIWLFIGIFFLHLIIEYLKNKK